MQWNVCHSDCTIVQRSLHFLARTTIIASTCSTSWDANYKALPTLTHWQRTRFVAIPVISWVIHHRKDFKDKQFLIILGKPIVRLIMLNVTHGLLLWHQDKSPTNTRKRIHHVGPMSLTSCFWNLVFSPNMSSWPLPVFFWKKYHLSDEDLSNYRFISHLSFFYKLTEREVKQHFTDYPLCC